MAVPRREREEEEKPEGGRHVEGAEGPLVAQPQTEAEKNMQISHTVQVLRERGELWRLVG